MKKANLELATKIIKKHIEKNEVAGNWQADLLAHLGMVLGSYETKKADAVEDMAKQLAGELDNGNLVLADGWAKTNGYTG